MIPVISSLFEMSIETNKGLKKLKYGLDIVRDSD
jgi:hypothetical protein